MQVGEQREASSEDEIMKRRIKDDKRRKCPNQQIAVAWMPMPRPCKFTCIACGASGPRRWELHWRCQQLCRRLVNKPGVAHSY